MYNTSLSVCLPVPICMRVYICMMSACLPACLSVPVCLCVNLYNAFLPVFLAVLVCLCIYIYIKRTKREKQNKWLLPSLSFRSNDRPSSEGRILCIYIYICISIYLYLYIYLYIYISLYIYIYRRKLLHSMYDKHACGALFLSLSPHALYVEAGDF